MRQSLYFICFIVLFPTYTWRCHGGHVPSVYGVYDIVGRIVRPTAAGVLGGAGRTLLTPHTLQTLASPSTENKGLKTNFLPKPRKYDNLLTLLGNQHKNFDIFKNEQNLAEFVARHLYGIKSCHIYCHML
jgi:hypothetical protein